MLKKSVVVDRIVDREHVVLLFEESKEEWIVPLSALPSTVREGVWLTITVDGSRIINVSIDDQKTKEATDRIEGKLAKLRQKQRSQFKRE